ncbi:hypothetical protein [Nocardia sp. NPDC005978]|uniref:hypothetical protein n=1 Tax=unclassified Nocardia TaxID=2637762 RepID=UPI0033AAD44C
MKRYLTGILLTGAVVGGALAATTGTAAAANTGSSTGSWGVDAAILVIGSGSTESPFGTACPADNSPCGLPSGSFDQLVVNPLLTALLGSPDQSPFASGSSGGGVPE